MPYEQRVDRTKPGCVLFLLDQSKSMEEEIGGSPGTSKAEALAEAVNHILFELVLRCIKDPNEGPRPYYDVGVIGYGTKIRPALGGNLVGKDLVSIVDVANYPLRIDERAPRVQDDRPATGSAKSPVWFDPVANGATPMGEAINRAGQLLSAWVGKHPNSFPPIVINISDGAATDGDPRVWATRLSTLSTTDGNVLLFNLNLSVHDVDEILYPSDASRLPDDLARVLFDMSSVLPSFMTRLAAAQGLPAQEGSRGFVFNAGMSALVTFLQIGTATAHMTA